MTGARLTDTISTGNLLTIIAMVIGGAVMWGANGQRIAAVERDVAAQAAEIRTMSAAHRSETSAVLGLLSELKVQIARQEEYARAIAAAVARLERNAGEGGP